MTLFYISLDASNHISSDCPRLPSNYLLQQFKCGLNIINYLILRAYLNYFLKNIHVRQTSNSTGTTRSVTLTHKNTTIMSSHAKNKKLFKNIQL